MMCAPTDTKHNVSENYNPELAKRALRINLENQSITDVSRRANINGHVSDKCPSIKSQTFGLDM